MKTIKIVLATDQILDWESFHYSCKEAFGFPDFYGKNMNAWIDCLSYVDEDDGMSRLDLSRGDVLNIVVENSAAFKQRVPDVFDALVDCTEFVNQRYKDRDSTTQLALIFQ